MLNQAGLATFGIQAQVIGVDPIIAEINGFRDIFDLNRIGARLLHDAASEIHDQMEQELDPDGMPWPALDPTYEKWKDQIAPGKPIGELFGLMKSFDQILGTQGISVHQADMTYGTDPVAITEAVKFTYGGLVTGTRQPQRHFYALPASAISRCTTFLEGEFTNAVL